MTKTNAKAPANGLLTQAGPINNLMAATFSQFNGAMLDAIVTLQRESVGFLGKRLSSDLNFQRNAMEVREIGQLSQLQQDWIAETLADYSAQTAKIIEVTTRAAKAEAENLAEAQSSLTKAVSEHAEAYKPSIAAE